MYDCIQKANIEVIKKLLTIMVLGFAVSYAFKDNLSNN